jgi:hypothetical protein
MRNPTKNRVEITGYLAAAANCDHNTRDNWRRRGLLSGLDLARTNRC